MMGLLFFSGIISTISLLAGLAGLPGFSDTVKNFWTKFVWRRRFYLLGVLAFVQMCLAFAFFVFFHGLTTYSRPELIFAALLFLVPGLVSISMANKINRAFAQFSQSRIGKWLKIEQTEQDRLGKAVCVQSTYFFFLTVLAFFAIIDPEVAMKPAVALGVFAFVLGVIFFWVRGIYLGTVNTFPATFFTFIFILELAYLGFTYTPWWRAWRYDGEYNQPLAVVLYTFELRDENFQGLKVYTTVADTVMLGDRYYKKYAGQKTVWVTLRTDAIKNAHIPIYDGPKGIVPITCIRPIGQKFSDASGSGNTGGGAGGGNLGGGMTGGGGTSGAPGGNTFTGGYSGEGFDSATQPPDTVVAITIVNGDTMSFHNHGRYFLAVRGTQGHCTVAAGTTSCFFMADGPETSTNTFSFTALDGKGRMKVRVRKAGGKNINITT